METLFIGYQDSIVRASVNGGVEAQRVWEGAPVPMIAADPQDNDRLYVATLGQGLWRSLDGGATFARLPGLDRELVWAVVTSHSDRNADGVAAIYAGTQDSALYRSSDGGDSFEELTSVQEIPSRPSWSFPPAPDTHHVHQITLDHDDPDTIVFGIELGGVFWSRDRGVTWEQTAADPDPHTLRTHPTEPRRMYEGGGASYCASTDGGLTWERNLAGVPDDVRYFYGVAVDSGDPENVILSGAKDMFGGHAVIPGVPVWSTLLRLVEGEFHEITEGLPPRDGTAMGTLAAGGPGVFYYVTEPGDVYRSSDGGATFTVLDDGPEPVRGAKARAVLVLTH